MLRTARITPYQFVVADELNDWVNKKTGLVFRSHEDIAAATRMERSTVTKAIQHLQKCCLEVVEPPRQQRAARYRFKFPDVTTITSGVTNVKAAAVPDVTKTDPDVITPEPRRD